MTLTYLDVLPTLARVAGASAGIGRPRPHYSFVGSLERESLALAGDGWKLVRVGPTILRRDAASGARVHLFRIGEDALETRDLAAGNQPASLRVTNHYFHWESRLA